jgi:hypothetical protein
LNFSKQGPQLRSELLNSDKDAKVILAVLPVWERWKIPCLLNYGNWNDLPPPEVHAALWKRWAETHGASASWISHDEVEFSVDKPVQTKEEALAMAAEQFLYCPDLVHQTYGTLEELAASLVGAQTWCFWWD